MMDNSRTIPSSGSMNAIREFEERNRRTQYENTVRSPYGMKSIASASPKRATLPEPINTNPANPTDGREQNFEIDKRRNKEKERGS